MSSQHNFKNAADNKIISKFQFGLKIKHSTIHQLLRAVHHILLAFENKKVCIGVFPDITHNFELVWLLDLLFKLKSLLFTPYSLLINPVYTKEHLTQNYIYGAF